MDRLLNDLRLACRSLGRAPGFTVAAVLTLGLGVGLNLAVFGAVYGILWRPLAVPRPERLVTVWQNMERSGGGREEASGRAVFSDWRASALPLADTASETHLVLEGWRAAAADSRPAAFYTAASPGFFRAAGVPLVAGRLLAPSDTAAAPAVGLVNQAFARRFLDRRDPLGRRFRRFEGASPEGPWRTIVGVVGDVRAQSLARPPQPAFYVPLDQEPAEGVTVVARAAASPAAALRAVRQVTAELRPGQVVSDPGTLAAVLDLSLSPRRLSAGLLSAFAAVALLLAAVGLHGVIALAVAQRRREIAVRVALGAAPATIAAMVLRWSAAARRFGRAAICIEE
jgi:hypothetical protein